MSENVVRVLICDDKSESCYIINKYLEDNEWIDVCDCAHDGEEAIEKIQRLKPDIVLLDIVMPKLDGISVLRKLKEKQLEVQPKIIILTGIGDENITKEAFNLGACFYLIKPIEKRSLLETLEMINNFDKESLRINDKVIGYNNYIKKSNIEILIRKILIDLEVPTHMLGYNYIIQSVLIMINKSYSGNLSKQVYSKVAAQNGTTCECVEIAIRSVIYETTKIKSELFEKMFMFKSDKKDHTPIKKPTNSRFLTKVIEEIYFREV